MCAYTFGGGGGGHSTDVSQYITSSINLSKILFCQSVVCHTEVAAGSVFPLLFFLHSSPLWHKVVGIKQHALTYSYWNIISKTQIEWQNFLTLTGILFQSQFQPQTQLLSVCLTWWYTLVTCGHISLWAYWSVASMLHWPPFAWPSYGAHNDTPMSPSKPFSTSLRQPTSLCIILHWGPTNFVHLKSLLPVLSCVN